MKMRLRPELRDRVRGALIGAVIGDAFGSPLEGAPASSARQLAQRRAVSAGPWGYTDDASMFIALAESIRDTGTVAPVHLLQTLSSRYEPARGFGRGMKLAIRAFQDGTEWREVARAAWPEGSQGNGGAVRVGAVALRRWNAVEDLIRAAALATRVTHSHPEAMDSACMHARLVALVLYEPELLCDPGLALDAVEADIVSTPFAKDTAGKVRALLTSQREGDVQSLCGTSPLARESVPAAHVSFLRTHASFSEAIVAAASLGGDVDSICALVGCLAGALHGLSGIPPEWLGAIAHESPSSQELAGLADALIDLSPASFEGAAV
jgi:poly(ADP-ribose) glycohydrolase ARH3